MDKALNYLSLACKGSLAALGEEPAGAAARAGKACLVIVAEDASDHTWRRSLGFVAGTSQQCVRVPFTKAQLGQATGRASLALAAFTDPAMALAFLEALGQPEAYRAALESLETRTQRMRQRRAEAKAHLRNKRMGKRKPGPKPKRS